MRFLLIDDHALIRRGTRELLVEAYPEADVTEAASGEEVAELLSTGPFDLVFLDINLPGQSGLTILKTLQESSRQMPVLVLSHYTEEQYAIRALRGGARGYLTKSSAPEELVQAARTLLAGGKYLTDSLAQLLAGAVSGDAERPAHQALSDRELEVLRALGRGRSVKEIAADLTLSVKTVSTYRTRVLEKLQLRSNADLIRYALASNLVD